MRVVCYNSVKGIGKYNNDIFNIYNNFCYVMDGASALFNDNRFYNTSDLYEYMKLLKKYTLGARSIEDNLINGISQSNKHFGNINKYREYQLPTFTIAAIKEFKDSFSLYLLCDCLISILYKDGSVEVFSDYRYNKIKLKCKKAINIIDKLWILNVGKLKLKRIIWQHYRKLANAKDGYPVGSVNFNCIKNGLIKNITKDEVDKIIICTDGFYDQLGVPNNSTYFEKEVLEKMIANIDSFDDLTYILIENDSVKI